MHSDKARLKKEFSEWFREATHGMAETQVALAQILGYKQEQISRWLNAKVLPSLSTMLDLSKKTKRSLPTSFSDGTPSAPESRKDALQKLIRGRMADEQIHIPKLLKVAAGHPLYTPPDDAQSLPISRNEAERVLGAVIPAHGIETVAFAAEVRGDSMEPTLCNGDTLIVRRYHRPAQAPWIQDGAIYILAPDGGNEVQVKRLLLVGKDRLLVASDNHRYPPYSVGVGDDVIIGRAVQVIRKL